MKIRYVHHRPREVVPVGQKPFTAEPGNTYDLVSKVARELLKQPRIWQEDKTSEVKPSADKKEG